jgi:hypothetical protein
MIRSDNNEDPPVVEWEFEKILDYAKLDNGRWHYLVQWAALHEPSWPPVKNLLGCDDAVWAFHDSHPEAAGPPSLVKKRKNEKKAAREQTGPSNLSIRALNKMERCVTFSDEIVEITPKGETRRRYLIETQD